MSKILFVLALISFVALLMGCATTTYTDGSATFSRTSFLVDTEISQMIVTKPDGTSVTLEANSDESRAIGVAVSAAIKGIKP